MVDNDITFKDITFEKLIQVIFKECSGQTSTPVFFKKVAIMIKKKEVLEGDNYEIKNLKSNKECGLVTVAISSSCDCVTFVWDSWSTVEES